MSQVLTRTICADLIVPSIQGHATRDDAGALNAMASWNLRRLLDVTVATAIVVFLLPLLAVISLTIFLSSPGPVVFKQRRIGKDGHAFSCWKFRTMVTDAEEQLAALLSSDPQARAEWAKDHKLRYDPRVTFVGRLLRKSSLDELPQLFNVLSGTMSLVGPRPIVLAECSRYGRHFADYCAVSSGNHRALADQRAQRRQLSPSYRLRRAVQPSAVGHVKLRHPGVDDTPRRHAERRILTS